jgi:hypothetical protein
MSRVPKNKSRLSNRLSTIVRWRWLLPPMLSPGALFRGLSSSPGAFISAKPAASPCIRRNTPYFEMVLICKASDGYYIRNNLNFHAQVLTPVKRLLIDGNIRPDMLPCAARLGQAQPASPRVTRQPASPGQSRGVGGKYALRELERMWRAPRWCR